MPAAPFAAAADGPSRAACRPTTGAALFLIETDSMSLIGPASDTKDERQTQKGA